MNAPLELRSVSLDDKFRPDEGPVYLSAMQALVRLTIAQRARDRAAGLDTAGFVSGYRGSPIGGLDLAMMRAREHLERNAIRFQPGLNEDLAATAVWGTQQLEFLPGSRHDGVFALWYGKMPGVDRSGDVLRHGNSAGSSRHGGVLLVTGDDPAARSTSIADQTDLLYKAFMIPVLAPGSVQEVLDLGVHGYALSRYSGCWVALKLVSDIAEASAVVDGAIDRVRVALPEDYAPPEGGLHIRFPDWMLEAEVRLKNEKLYAALAYARANRLNDIVVDSPNARLGIAAVGKAWGDLRGALAMLGLDDARLAALGVRVMKISMPWPLEPVGLRRFARGLEEIVVIEEKRAFVEEQIKDELYHLPDAERPRVAGKLEALGQWNAAAPKQWLVPPTGELTPGVVARALVRRLATLGIEGGLAARIEHLVSTPTPTFGSQPASPLAQRQPWFCSGCPHNTSTRVPEGSRATAGIGCHSMAVWMNRSTITWTQMGGEGVPWIGQAPFCDTAHIFANLGDGTYYHSGLLAIRAAVAARVPITYKILYNDAVAMTGGQPIDGPLSPAAIARQVAAEGVERIVVASDEPEKYGRAEFPAGVTVHHRDALDALQRELREYRGVSVLIYDQTCAAEKRRRRKRGAFPDPAKRAFINQEVCEGCGDCTTQSNCLSIEPLVTEFGVKRTINQGSCNKDYSCLKGFCPAFVTVHGGALRRTQAAKLAPPDVAPPATPAPDAATSILVTGIGGTGVVTIGALLGMAAHLEGKAVSVLDVTGLAQKGGAVMSHVRIARDHADIEGTRIGEAQADAVIACDLVVAAGPEARAKMRRGHTRVAGNSAPLPTAAAALAPESAPSAERLEDELRAQLGRDALHCTPATRLALALTGDALATNVFMLGYAWQQGMIPLGATAILRAIELNGASVESNTRAFQWGCAAAVDPAAVERAAQSTGPAQIVSLQSRPAQDLDEILRRRVAWLIDYQDAAYAQRYAKLVARVREAEQALGGTALAEAVARQYARLLAYKDEYEVARLHTRPEFLARLDAAFEGDTELRFHFAPPFISRPDAQTGIARKREFGSWIVPLLRLLARGKRLRGSAWDAFGYSAERRTERRLIAEYEALVEELLAGLDARRLELAVALASLPENIRGFGHIKAKRLAETKARERALLGRWRSGEVEAAQAA